MPRSVTPPSRNGRWFLIACAIRAPPLRAFSQIFSFTGSFHPGQSESGGLVLYDRSCRVDMPSNAAASFCRQFGIEDRSCVRGPPMHVFFRVA